MVNLMVYSGENHVMRYDEGDLQMKDDFLELILEFFLTFAVMEML